MIALSGLRSRRGPRRTSTPCSCLLLLCIVLLQLDSACAQPGFTNLVFYVGGIPLFIDLWHDSDPAQVAKACCEELVQLGQENIDMDRCSQSFITSLITNIEELKRDHALGRTRTTFDDESRRHILTGIDIGGAFKDFLETCGASADDPSAATRFAFNPEDPHLCVPLPAPFTAVPLQPLLPNPDVIADFVGGVTARLQDCASASVVPSRRFECERHGIATAHPELPWAPLTPLYPAVDEEFFEWSDTLLAVLHAPSSAPLVVVEIGAGHAPWAVRAAAANRLLRQRPLHLSLVEAHPEALQQLQTHLALNRLPLTNISLWRAAIGAAQGRSTFHTGACSLASGHAEPDMLPERDGGGAAASEISQPDRITPLDGILQREEFSSADGASVPGRMLGRAPRREGGGAALEEVAVVTIGRVLAEHSLVDLLDIDVQGAEAFALPAALPEIEAKVRRMHVGTHSLAIHQRLRTLLTARGWDLQEDWAPQSRAQTRFGWVTFRDGVLSAVNPALMSADE